MSLERASILMVDDRPENLIALEAILEPLGHRLVRASSGEDALRQVLREEFAVILMDVQMPGMNGFETVQLIKSRPRSRHVPIIFLTAISKDEEYVFEGYSTGAVDYLFKPFNPAILRSKVAVFVDLYLKGRKLEAQSRELREIERRELELRHRMELSESEARYAQILESATEAIITFGMDRRIAVFNVAAERTFDLDHEEAIGRPVEDLFRPPMDAVFLETVASSGRSGRVHREELTGLRRGGGEFPVEVSVSCLTLSDETVYTVITRDISERKRAEESLRSQALSLETTSEELRAVNEELNRRQEDLERAMSARSRFYASMSHELRTPINAILGYTSLILDNIFGELNEKQADSLQRANKAAEHLLELVNDVLDLSKIEAGKMEVLLAPVEFPGIIRELLITVGPMAEQQSVELSLAGDEEGFWIRSDPRRVRQILFNLLSNALKFGLGKPVTVTCTRADDGAAVIDVTDHGEGIPAEEWSSIFEEFVQLHGEKGTGLGLPISRRLARLLGGTLEIARSEIGHGSTFRLTLPASMEPPDAAGVFERSVLDTVHAA